MLLLWVARSALTVIFLAGVQLFIADLNVHEVALTRTKSRFALLCTFTDTAASSELKVLASGDLRSVTLTSAAGSAVIHLMITATIEVHLKDCFFRFASWLAAADFTAFDSSHPSP